MTRLVSASNLVSSSRNGVIGLTRSPRARSVSQSPMPGQPLSVIVSIVLGNYSGVLWVTAAARRSTPNEVAANERRITRQRVRIRPIIALIFSRIKFRQAFWEGPIDYLSFVKVL